MPAATVAAPSPTQGDVLADSRFMEFLKRGAADVWAFPTFQKQLDR